MLDTARLQTIVPCSSWDRVAHFYLQTLGLSRFQRRFNGATIDVGGSDLCVCEVPQMQPSEHTVFGFGVADVACAVSALRTRGVDVARFDHMAHDFDGIATAPDGTRVAWIRDPDGNIVSLVQYPAQ
jgi:hypothetical protein